MITFKTLKIKNFLSFGNSETVLDLTKDPLTLIKGYNLDKPGESEEARSGTGKSSVLQALHYALFGKSINNEIKLANIINKTNKKNLEVTLTFEKDGIEYRIERGRKPEYLRFIVNNIETEDDEAQGENSKTQEQIQEILGFEPDIFNQTFLLTKNVESFLKQPLATQRDIIEQLIGTTILTLKADALKVKIKEYKQFVGEETVRLQTVKSSNQQIIDQHNQTIEKIKSQQQNWNVEHQDKIEKLKTYLEGLKSFDIQDELEKHEFNAEQIKIKEQKEKQDNEIKDLNNQVNSLIQEGFGIQKQLTELQNVNVDQEKQLYESWDVYNKAVEDYNIKVAAQELINKEVDLAKSKVSSLHNAIVKLDKDIDELESNIKMFQANVCPMCGQALHDEHSKLKQTFIENLANKKIEREEKQGEFDEAGKDYEIAIQKIKPVESISVPKPDKQPHYKDQKDLYEHENKVRNLVKDGQVLAEKVKDLQEKIKSYPELVYQEAKPTYYKMKELAMQHISLITSCESNIDTLLKEENPFDKTLSEMKEPELIPYDESKLNETLRIQKHSELLVKLLTDKDSFIRKKVLERNLNFLNQLIKKYMLKIGSIHEVNFLPDMSVDIVKQGESFDFANLSEGEKTAVTLSLNFAFRELFERLNESINLLCFDEREGGLDKQMVRNFIDMLQNIKDKNIFVISHREEFIRTIPNQITCQMLRGFTTIKGENMIKEMEQEINSLDDAFNSVMGE